MDFSVSWEIGLMNKPNIPQKEPIAQFLEAGDYWWCACGMSSNQPFCDGSHKGTSFAPQKFTIAAPKTVYICACKHSLNAPFCDGNHKSI